MNFWSSEVLEFWVSTFFCYPSWKTRVRSYRNSLDFIDWSYPEVETHCYVAFNLVALLLRRSPVEISFGLIYLSNNTFFQRCLDAFLDGGYSFTFLGSDAIALHFGCRKAKQFIGKVLSWFTSCACLIVFPFYRAFKITVDYLLLVEMHQLSDLLEQGCQVALETTVRQPVRK